MLHQVAVERAPRLAGLSRCVDHQRTIPVGDVEDLTTAGPIRRDCAGAAAALDGRYVECGNEWMRKRSDVPASPAPGAPVRPLIACQALDGLLQPSFDTVFPTAFGMFTKGLVVATDSPNVGSGSDTRQALIASVAIWGLMLVGIGLRLVLFL